jgi:hypothetical protein
MGWRILKVKKSFLSYLKSFQEPASLLPLRSRLAWMQRVLPGSFREEKASRYVQDEFSALLKAVDGQLETAGGDEPENLEGD